MFNVSTNVVTRLQRRLCIAGLVPVLFLALAANVHAAPTNDFFTNAIVLVGGSGTVAGTTIGASKETSDGEDDHAGNPGGHSIWYRWTSPLDGKVTFDTTGSSFDTLLAAYEGTSVGALTEDDSNDDILDGQVLVSRISFDVSAGSSYWIAVDGKDGAVGSVVLNWKSGSQYAGSFRFTTDTFGGTSDAFGEAFFVVSEGDGVLLRDVPMRSFNGTRATVTVTRDSGFAGAVDVDYSAGFVTDAGSGLYAITNSYITNHIDGTNFSSIVVLDTVNTNITTNNAFADNIFPPDLLFGAFSTNIVSAGPGYPKINVTITDNSTNIFVQKKQGNQTNTYITNQISGTLLFITNTVNQQTTSSNSTTFAGEALPASFAQILFAGAFITNISQVDPDFPGLDMSVTMTVNSTNVTIVETFLADSLVTGTIHFENYQMSQTFSLDIPRDQINGPSRFVPLSLVAATLDPNDDQSIVEPDIDFDNGTSILKVLDDDGDPRGQVADVALNFERRNFRVGESHGDATIYVRRTGTNTGAVSIDYSIDPLPYSHFFTLRPASDYATPDADFTPVTGTVSWADKDFTPQPIVIPIIDDTLVEFNEDFLVHLANGPCGSVSNAIVTILYDDQAAGAVDLSYNADNSANTFPYVYNPSPGANGAVYAVALQSNGKGIIGGDFNAVNATTRLHLARLTTSGLLDTTYDPGTGPDQFVASIVANANGTAYIGGAFQSVNGSQRSCIARLLAGGQVDDSFNPGLGCNGIVWSMVRQLDGKLVIAGDFTQVNGITCKHVARLNTDGSVDQTFNTTQAFDDSIFALALQSDGKILLGGQFTFYGNSSRNGLARLNTDGSLDATFDPGAGADSIVQTLALQVDGKVLVGGAFNSIDFRTKNHLARLNSDGSLDTAFSSGIGADGTVYSIALQADAKVIIAGQFTSYNQTHRSGLARLYTDGTLDTTFMDTAYNQFAGVRDPYYGYTTNSIYSISLQADEDLVIGGSFDRLGGGSSRDDARNRNNFARIQGGSTAGPGNLQLAYDSYSADENDSNYYVTVERINGNLGPVSVTFNTNGPPAGLGVADQLDYVFNPTGSLRNGPGALNGTPAWFSQYPGTWEVSPSTSQLEYPAVKVNRDTLVEGNELAYFKLSNPSSGDFLLGGERIALGAALGRDFSTFTIIDANTLPGTIAFASAEYQVNENAGSVLITVIRTNGNFGAPQFQFATTGGTATPGVDYVLTNGTARFSPGATSTTFRVFIINDTLKEADETINLSIFNPSTGTIASNGGSAQLTIIDDDVTTGRLGFSATNYNVTENGGFATVTVNRTGGNAGQISVYYATGDGTATNFVDYLGSTNLLTWDSLDSAAKTFTVPLIDNNLVDNSRVVNLKLFNPSISDALDYGTITNATLTISNEDAYGTIGFVSTTNRVNENAGSLRVLVTRTSGTNGFLTVDYTTLDGTAVTGTDYATASGTLSFAPGELLKWIDVGITDNAAQVTGPYLVFNLVLSNVQPSGTNGAHLGISTTTVAIVDDETVTEPAGSVDPTFNVSLGANDLVYSASIQDGSVQGTNMVIAGGDFTQMNGVTRKRIARLSNSGALDGRFSGSSLGANDSVRAVLSQAMDTNALGRVLLGGFFTTVNATNRNHIARLNLDGTMDGTFNPGAGADGPVFAIAETIVESAAKVLIGGSFNLVNGTPKAGLARLNSNGSVDASFSTGVGVNGTVYAIAVQPDGKIVIGGDFTSVNNVPRNRVARLLPDGSLDLSFDVGVGPNNTVKTIAIHPDGGVLVGGVFTSIAGNNISYLARLDVYGIVDSSFNPAPNDVVYAIAVQIDGKILVGGEFSRANDVTRSRITRLNSDGSVDPHINFGTGADNFISTIALQADGNIIIGGGFTHFDGVQRSHIARLFSGEIDGVGTFEFTSPTYSVDEIGTNVVIGIRRRAGTDERTGPVSVQFSCTDITATNGADYLAISTNINFPRGETFRSVIIPVLHNTSHLTDGTVGLLISNPTGDAAVSNQVTATLTIINDDSTIGLLSPNFSVNENTINGAVLIPLVRSGALSGTVAVDVATLGGTAVPGVRYLATNTTIIFNDGETNKTFLIKIINDNIVEGDQTVGIVLTNFQAAIPGSSNSVLTIIEDDFGPGSFSFATNNFNVIENAGFGTVTVIRTNGHTGNVSVHIDTSDGLAVAGADYIATNKALVFADGQTSNTFFVQILNDSVIEPDETINLTLSAPVGGSLGGLRNATLTILDDDYTPNYLTFAATNFTVNEADGHATITVSRATGRRGTISVDFAATAGTAVNGLDFVATNGTLVFLDNEAEKSFDVAILNNAIIQQRRTVNLALSNPQPASNTFLSISNAELTILDDDLPAGTLDPSFGANYGADSTVWAVTYEDDSHLYVGGDFNYLHGLNIPHLARVNTNGTVDLSFNPGSGPDGSVYALAATTNNILIGGSFTNVNGTASPGMARLLRNGQLDLSFSVGAGIAGYVSAISIQSNEGIVIGGNFSAVDGLPINNVARLFANGNIDPSFDLGAGANGPVQAVAVQTNGQIIIGGDFTSINNTLFTRLARVNQNGAIDFNFDTGLGADAAVRAITLQTDGKILVAGDFVTFNGVPRNHIVRLNSDGTVDLSFDPGDGANDSIYSVLFDAQGKVVVGGHFTTFNGNAYNHLVRLNADGSTDSLFNIGSGANGSVNAIALFYKPAPDVCIPPSPAVMTFDALLPDFADITNYVENCIHIFGVTGGHFHTTTNAAGSNTVAEVFGVDGSPQEVNINGAQFALRSIKILDVFGSVIFTNSNGGSVVITQPGLINFDSTFSNITFFRMIVPNGAFAMDDIVIDPVPIPVIPPTEFYAVGGDFTLISGIPRGRIAVLDLNGAIDRNFDADVGITSIAGIGIYTNDPQNTLYGKVIVAGAFNALVGVAGENGIGRLNSDGTLDRSFSTGAGFDAGASSVLVQSDGRVIVGGSFKTYDSISRSYLARLNTDGSLDGGFNSGVGLNNSVSAMALQQDGKVIVGGDFTSVYGAARKSIARVHTNGTVDVTFTPGQGCDGTVKAVALQQDGKVLIGGEFKSVNGNTNFPYFARLNTNGTLDISFIASVNGAVSAIAVQPDGGILLGGLFSKVGNVSCGHLARVGTSGGADISFNAGTGANDYVNAIVLQQDGKIVVGGGFTTFADQIHNRLVRLTASGLIDPTVNYGTAANDFINAGLIQAFDGKLVVAGAFSKFDNHVRLGVARVFGGENTGVGTFRFENDTYSANERTSAVITIVRDGGTANAVSIDFNTVDGTAIHGTDYIATNGTLAFSAGESVKTITIPFIDNLVTNVDKHFGVALSNPSNGASLGSPSSADVAIVDNDCVISLSSATYFASESAGFARITVIRSGGSLETATVSYLTTTNGTATPGLDFTPQASTLVFGPGVNVQSFDIAITNDTVIEQNETVEIGLFGQTGPATLGRTNALLTIIEDDFGAGVISLASNSFRVNENSGNVIVTFIRTNGFSGSISAAYTITNGTATAGFDYLATNGVVTFDAGEVIKTISIQILNDDLVEGNETFFVQLSNPTGGATLGQASADITIVDDDSPGLFEFAQPVLSVSENAGFASITVFRNAGSIGVASVRYETGNAGTATVGVDYQAVSGVLNFANGETSQTFLVPIIDDTIAEGTETINLILSEPTGGAAVGPNGNAMLQIKDNELSFSFASPSYSIAENGVIATINVSRTGDTNNTVSVNFATTDGSALAGFDYVSTNGVLTFGPGQTNATFDVHVLEDTISENTEAINLTLSNPSAGTVGPNITAPLLIYDNDTTFNFSLPTYSVLESVSNVLITVTRFGGTNFTSSVNVGVTGGTASNSLDFSFSGVTLSFLPGQSTASFTVPILEDLLIEGNETVNLALFSPVNGVLGNQPAAVLTILDNDMGVGFSSSTYIVNENATNALITLRRHGAATNSLSVTVYTANGTATAGQDYGAVNQTVTWGSGDLSDKTIMIPIASDLVLEGSETVNLILTNATGGALIEAGSAVLTIVDDAGNISFASANYTGNESDGFAAIQLIRSGGSNGIVSVQYSVNGGTATAGLDYTNASGTVAFGNGEVSKTIIIPLINDTIVEGSETVNLILSNPGGAALLGSPTAATLTIIDDEVDIRALGASLISESFVPTNGVIESGETVTVQLALRNLGSVNTANLVATLQTNSGVTPLTVSRSYGALLGNGSSVSQPFTFVANGTNGSVVSVQLKLTDSSTDLGAVSFTFTLGTSTIVFANAGSITINDHAAATPYPSVVNVSGISGVISKVTATLNNFNHTFSHDVQVLLVSPAGQSCVLMANCGNGANGVTLTFDDSASSSLPSSQMLASGTFKPTRYGFATFPANTPSGTSGTNLFVFNGANPNGSWGLYVYDAQAQDVGFIGGGWSLSISSSNVVTSSADVGVVVTDSPDPVVVGGLLTYTVSVRNYGPGAADNVAVANTLPTGVAFVSASRPVTNNNGVISCNVGTLTNGASVNFTITATAPNTIGNVTNVTSVAALQNDGNTSNNSISIKTSVINVPPMAFTVKGSNFVISWPAVASNFVLEYTTTLSPANWQAYGGGAAVANGQSSVSVPISNTGNVFYRLRLVP